MFLRGHGSLFTPQPREITYHQVGDFLFYEQVQNLQPQNQSGPPKSPIDFLGRGGAAKRLRARANKGFQGTGARDTELATTRFKSSLRNQRNNSSTRMGCSFYIYIKKVFTIVRAFFPRLFFHSAKKISKKHLTNRVACDIICSNKSHAI